MQHHNKMTMCIYFKLKDVLHERHHQAIGKCRASVRVEYTMLASMPPTVRQMALFNSTKVVEELRYTGDFKYPHKQKSGVKSGDREGQSNLQP